MTPMRLLVAASFAAIAATAALSAETQDVPSATSPKPPASDAASPTEIAWEDLMPAGEEERLSELYEAFFEELDAKMRRSSAVMLNEFGGMSVAEGSAADTMPQIGTFNVVENLDGRSVRMPGYVVPLDFDAKDEHAEFLLVPYFGACLHTPPPPPNQIVYVTAEPAAKVEDIWQPVWVEGVMTTGEFKNDTGDAAYKLSLSKIEIYEY